MGENRGLAGNPSSPYLRTRACTGTPNEVEVQSCFRSRSKHFLTGQCLYVRSHPSRPEKCRHVPYGPRERVQQPSDWWRMVQVWPTPLLEREELLLWQYCGRSYMQNHQDGVRDTPTIETMEFSSACANVAHFRFVQAFRWDDPPSRDRPYRFSG